MMLPKGSIRLSPSVLNTFCECPRCFWLSKIMKLNRPRGIFSTLPSGMDRAIKEHFDGFRKVNGLIPPGFSQIDDGIKLYQGQSELNKWRAWNSTDLIYMITEGFYLSGAIDELMITEDGLFVPADYKTKGFLFKSDEDAKIYATRYYQNQMDCYALMMEECGHKVSKEGYLLYYIPAYEKGIDIIDDNNRVQFDTRAIPMEINIESARKTAQDAVSCLKGKEPASGEECGYCKFEEERMKYRKQK